MKEKLKIGLLLNNYFIPSWEYQIVADIANSDYAKIVLVIKNDPVLAGEKETGVPNGIIKLIEKTDRAVFKTRPDYKLKKDISSLLKDVYELEISRGNPSDSVGFTTEEIKTVRNINPDLILKFGFHNLNEEILNLSKYGVWTYSIESSREDGLPGRGFWEVIEKVPVTNSTLEILTPDEDRTDVIFSGWESTCQYSVNVNRDSLSWRSALFAPRVINGLFEFGEGYLDVLKARFVNEKQDAGVPLSKLSLTDAASGFFRYMGGVTKSIIKKLVYTDAFRWQLQFDIKDGGQVPSDSYSSFRKLLSPEGIFWADPFVIAGDDCYWLFVEEFIYKKDRAHITVLKLGKEGNLIDSHKIIERPYHMSYPFVFKVDNTYYMIPETSKNKTIELYKCIEFPYKWEFEMNIMENVSAVDSTLFHYNNKWWLFTAMDQTANISGCSAELFLFYSDDIFTGNWKSHRLNPIVSDIRTARPAGKIFLRDGEIYRPSQNCAGRYGVALNLNHITKLSGNEYEETLVTEVRPVWDKSLKGVHTLNSDRDFTVIDAYSFRSRLSI
jgi:hypothetical protein